MIYRRVFGLRFYPPAVSQRPARGTNPAHLDK